ncbi:MAG TPA: hypothetical protein ENO03_08985, partial [Candidatus Aminicenantes bacterium]|nr:hypothetical protein [Candidatus Aminicenantes bacterium]
MKESRAYDDNRPKDIDKARSNRYCLWAFSAMRLRFLWPGKTKNPELRGVQDLYRSRIRPLADIEIVETRAARGLEEKHAGRIKELEAQGLERHLAGAYVICLDERGKEMTSGELARFLRSRERDSGTTLAFV